jgi:nucleotide-binding universal stress UspA family protein
MGGDVVVGVDGTVSSQRAVLWAAEAARIRSARLVLVHALREAEPRSVDGWSRLVGGDAALFLENEKRRVQRAEPGVVVVAVPEDNSPARVLARLSRGASLLVVGTRRTSRCARPWSGMLEYQVVAGSVCSVAVVPPVTGMFQNRVVVGTDGSADSRAAVRAAADLAGRLGAVLEVLHAWQRAGQRDDGEEPDLGSPPAAPRELVRDVVDGLGAERPGLEIQGRLVESHPVAALMEAAARSRVLVVGRRGAQRVPRVPVGSTSHALVLASPCALLVTRRA